MMQLCDYPDFNQLFSRQIQQQQEGLNLLDRKVNRCFVMTEQAQNNPESPHASPQDNTINNTQNLCQPTGIFGAAPSNRDLPVSIPAITLAEAPNPNIYTPLPETPKLIVPNAPRRTKKFVNRDRIKKQNQNLIPALTYQQAIDDLKLMGQSQNPERDQAMLACLFLTGCRISEITRFYPNNNSKAWLNKNETFRDQLSTQGFIESLKKSQVEILPDGFQLHRVRILKRKQDIKKEVPVLITPQEKPFIDAFLLYYNHLGPGDHEMFPITRIRAWQLISKHTQHFCHLYRHTRATILVSGRYYQLNEAQLRMYLGWNDERSSKGYIHLTTNDLRNALQKNPFSSN